MKNGIGAGMNDKMPKSQHGTAESFLKEAIEMHKKHMDGSMPTDRKSQMKIMELMKSALAAIHPNH